MTRISHHSLSILAAALFVIIVAPSVLARGANSRGLRIAPFRSAPRMTQFRHFNFDMANLQLNRHRKNERYLMLDQGF